MQFQKFKSCRSCEFWSLFHTGQSKSIIKCFTTSVNRFLKRGFLNRPSSREIGGPTI